MTMSVCWMTLPTLSGKLPALCLKAVLTYLVLGQTLVLFYEEPTVEQLFLLRTLS